MKIYPFLILLFATSLNAITVHFNSETFLSKNISLPQPVTYDNQLDDFIASDYSHIDNYSRDFSFEIVGLNEGTGTLDQLSSLIGSNQVVLNFNLDGNLYSTNSNSEITNDPSIDNDVMVGISGSDSYYTLNQEGLSITYSGLNWGIFEVYTATGDGPMIHQFVDNSSGAVPEVLLGNGGDYLTIYSNENISQFTVFYEVVPEPSTYALILGAVALGFTIIRRK